MPFDDKTYLRPETQPAVFSLEGLIAWLERQDPATAYMPSNVTRCVLCQWLSAASRSDVVYARAGIYTNGSRDFDMSDIEFEVTGRIGLLDGTEPQTFGSALNRARKLASRKGD